MKRLIYKKLYLFTMLAIFSLISCQEQELDIQEPVSITDELEKVETIFKDGDIKIENDLSEEKIETIASPELSAKLERELMKSYTKQKTSLKTSAFGYVGVLKDGTCGGYEELTLFMDCEDRRPASKEHGWIGDSDVDRNKNVTLKFCFVPNSFKRTNYDFAVLNVTSTVPYGVSSITRHFDNEDGGNANKLFKNNIDLRKHSYFYQIGGNYFYKNTILSFLYYPRVNRSNPPSSLGFPYGVLGQFGDSRGYIITDDEDRGNVNWCNLSNKRTKSNIPNIMDIGRNTKLYISRISI